MRIVTAQELGSWLAGGKVLEEDARGPKVVALKNGLFLKIFHNRRHPLLARLFPFAERFTRNTERLRDLGIPSPEVVENFWITKEKGLSGCIYRPLPGTSLEIIYRDSPEDFFSSIPRLAKFIRELHNKGIYFRSLHLGNIVLTPNGELGLIDVLDLRKKHAPLNNRLTARNFDHLNSYLERNKITDFPMEEMLKIYRSL
ncbi:lipopolysaccharide kinase InaA family protein [Stutzerimonas azotifigens]|uniref:lipopolysaccharide kinase InaA family protein n=1 Tax=Stutzerimonas azotifigens TaxID=291995 RepID=UPI000415A5A5|nr:lipopolysaccharide kinase InaA family protein [Stutzerimonas azotifigens]